MYFYKYKLKQIEEDESDDDDYTVHSSDLILATVTSNEDISECELHLYDTTDGSFFLHHDFPVGPFPLAIEWCDRAKGVDDKQSLNFLAIGTFLPNIEIWNGDSSEPAPRGSLGKLDENQKPIGDCHNGAVLTLCWNKTFRNVLGSGSDDSTIKIWDIIKEECSATFKQKDKVQTLKWNNVESSIFISGINQYLTGIDVRTPNNIFNYKLPSSIEHVEWNPFNPTNVLASSENGSIYSYDLKTNTLLFNLQAHNESCSCLSFSTKIPGLLATSSSDKSVKLWDVFNNVPRHISTKTMTIGDILCCSFNNNANIPILSCGGTDSIAIWDLSGESGLLSSCTSRDIPTIPDTPVY